MEPRMEKSFRLSTRSIQAGMDADSETKAAQRALIVSDNYAIPPVEGCAAVPYAYGRDLNPNACRLEEDLIAMEGGEACAVSSSGEFADHGTLLAILTSGDHILASEIACGSVRTMLLEDFPKRFGISATRVDRSVAPIKGSFDHLGRKSRLHLCQ